MLTTIHLNVKHQLGCLSENKMVHKCQNINRDEGGAEKEGPVREDSNKYFSKYENQ